MIAILFLGTFSLTEAATDNTNKNQKSLKTNIGTLNDVRTEVGDYSEKLACQDDPNSYACKQTKNLNAAADFGFAIIVVAFVGGFAIVGVPVIWKFLDNFI